MLLGLTGGGDDCFFTTVHRYIDRSPRRVKACRTKPDTMCSNFSFFGRSSDDPRYTHGHMHARVWTTGLLVHTARHTTNHKHKHRHRQTRTQNEKRKKQTNKRCICSSSFTRGLLLRVSLSFFFVSPLACRVLHVLLFLRQVIPSPTKDVPGTVVYYYYSESSFSPPTSTVLYLSLPALYSPPTLH